MKKFLLRDEVLEAIRSMYNNYEVHCPESYALSSCEDIIESLDYFVGDENEQENV